MSIVKVSTPIANKTENGCWATGTQTGPALLRFLWSVDGITEVDTASVMAPGGSYILFYLSRSPHLEETQEKSEAGNTWKKPGPPISR